LKDFDISATMARQGGWVQLEQSNMRLALNIAKMAKGGFLGATIAEPQHLIEKPHAAIEPMQMWGVVFPR
jgi:hypothetical protein